VLRLRTDGSFRRRSRPPLTLRAGWRQWPATPGHAPNDSKTRGRSPIGDRPLFVQTWGSAQRARAYTGLTETFCHQRDVANIDEAIQVEIVALIARRLTFPKGPDL